MKILLFTKYDQSGASSRYRTLQYLKFLKSQGADITVSSLLDSKHIFKIFNKQKPSPWYYLKRALLRLMDLTFKKRSHDLCWIEGELFPYLPYFVEKFFLPKYYVTEYDDAIFHNYNLHRNPLIRKLLGNKINKIMRNSQHVIVGNDYVKEHAEAAGAKKVTILPTVVDAEIYKPCSDQPTQAAVTIGWLGSPTTVKYLTNIESVLLKIAKRIDIKLLVIGGEYQMDGINMECHHWPDKWSEAEEITLLNKIDIGIMPLINTPWEQGKCGFKLIKYMACAKPSIASPVSKNKEIVVHGVNGYLANSIEEWEEYLMKLILNKDLRDQFGEQGRKLMLEKYSLQYTAPILKNILCANLKVTG